MKYTNRFLKALVNYTL